MELFLIFLIVIVVILGLFLLVVLIDALIHFDIEWSVILGIFLCILVMLLMMISKDYKNLENKGKNIELDVTQDTFHVSALNHTFDELHTFKKREILIRNGISRICFNKGVDATNIEIPKPGDIIEKFELENLKYIYYECFYLDDESTRTYYHAPIEDCEIHYVEDDTTPYVEIYTWEDNYSKYIFYIPVETDLSYKEDWYE